jgi:hypothetical protein
MVLQNLIFAQIVKKFPVFYRTQMIMRINYALDHKHAILFVF